MSRFLLRIAISLTKIQIAEFKTSKKIGELFLNPDKISQQWRYICENEYPNHMNILVTDFHFVK